MSSFKQSAKSLIELLGLGKTVDKLRFYKQYWANKKKIAAFRAANPNLALPNPFMIYETFRLDYDRYINSGKEDAQAIIEEVNPFVDLSGKTILDWGCGPARIIRHFPDLIRDGQFYGSDYNAEYIDWCKDNLEQITFLENKLAPPLLIDEASVDFAYAISIFTHLSEQKHYEWINEIARILKSGGIFYFTAHGDVTKQNLHTQEIAKYNSGLMVERGNVKEGYRMYTAYHPTEFINKLVSEQFTVLKHRPGVPKNWGLEQDVWIIKKK